MQHGYVQNEIRRLPANPGTVNRVHLLSLFVLKYRRKSSLFEGKTFFDQNDNNWNYDHLDGTLYRHSCACHIISMVNPRCDADIQQLMQTKRRHVPSCKIDNERTILYAATKTLG